MAGFALQLGPELLPQLGEGVVRGRIIIGDFSEGFGASTGCWSAREYLEQWLRAAAHLAAGGEAATFVVDMHDAAADDARATLWTCYRIGSREVAFRNTFAAISDFVREPDSMIALRPEHWLPARHAAAEGGLPVSEWRLDEAEFSIDLRIVFPLATAAWAASEPIARR